MKDTFHWAVNITILIIVSMILGSFLSLHLYAQTSNVDSGNETIQKYINQDLQTSISVNSQDIKELKLDYSTIQSEIDTTRGLGAGISAAVMFLQVLGLLKKRKET